MDAYEILLKGVTDKVSEANQSKGRQSFATSKSDLSTLATGFLNTPEHVVAEYTYSAKDTSGTGEPLKIEKRPAMRYRQSLIPILRELGSIRAMPRKSKRAQSSSLRSMPTLCLRWPSLFRRTI